MTNRAATSQAEETFISMLNGADTPDAEQLLELFSQLKPVSVDSVIGLWRVAAFGRPHTTRSRTSLNPALCPSVRASACASCMASASSLATTPSRSSAGPRTARSSRRSTLAWHVCANSSFRGTSSAGMVYDTQPWIDYFRKLDDDTLVAMIDMKGTRWASASSCCVADRAPSPG